MWNQTANTIGRWVITQTIQNRTGCYANMETSLSKVKQNVSSSCSPCSFWFVRQRLRKDSSLSALSEVHWTNSTCLLSLSTCPCQALFFYAINVYRKHEPTYRVVRFPWFFATIKVKADRFFRYFLKWYFFHRNHRK